MSDFNAGISLLGSRRYLEDEQPRTTAGICHSVAGRQDSLQVGLRPRRDYGHCPDSVRYYEMEFFADGHIESQTFGPADSVENPTLEEIAGAVIQDVNG